MTRRSRALTMAALLAFATSALCGSGCGPGAESAYAAPDKLAEAQKARKASYKGEADGLAKASRRR